MPGGITARTLAPSVEALDAPLSPAPLGDGPGPATGLSGFYPGGTCTHWSGPAFRTQHEVIVEAGDRSGKGARSVRRGRLFNLFGTGEAPIVMATSGLWDR